jgi:hypothetical protein
MKFSYQNATRISVYIGVVFVLIATLVTISPFLRLVSPEDRREAGVSQLVFIAQKAHCNGKIQPGHDALICVDCHTVSDGTVRQQLQAVSRNYLYGMDYDVNVGFLPVTSSECKNCHERPNERHPIYRFNEPRFINALDEVEANSCLGCHSEHTGERVSSVEIGFCKACHGSLKLKLDPLDVPHSKLVESKRWDTCLGCHDYHGNHTRTTPELLNSALGTSIIGNYFKDGPSPYGLIKTYLGNTSRE